MLIFSTASSFYCVKKLLKTTRLQEMVSNSGSCRRDLCSKFAEKFIQFSRHVLRGIVVVCNATLITR